MNLLKQFIYPVCKYLYTDAIYAKSLYIFKTLILKPLKVP